METIISLHVGFYSRIALWRGGKSDCKLSLGGTALGGHLGIALGMALGIGLVPCQASYQER